MRMITLDLLDIGAKGKIHSIDNSVANKHRLLELGFTKDSEIAPVNISICGDPVAYLIKDTVIALRKNEAQCINIITS